MSRAIHGGRYSLAVGVVSGAAKNLHVMHAGTVAIFDATPAVLQYLLISLASVVAEYTRTDDTPREVDHNASCNVAYIKHTLLEAGGFELSPPKGLLGRLFTKKTDLHAKAPPKRVRSEDEERRIARAKALVEQRKRLVRESDSVDRVALALDALTIGGDKAIEDSAIYLALRDVYWRLQRDTSAESVASAVDQLWALALKIEDGDLPEAERAVRDAQEKLSQALKDNASPEELQRLMDDLRQAMSQYMQSLAKQAQDKGNMPADQKQNGDQLVSEQDLDKMLSNIEKLAKNGSKDLAQQMLSELKDILDRMQTGNLADSAKQQRAQKMMKDMNELVSKQQKLLDETYGAKREHGDRNGDEFKVSPPGSPLAFGNGMFMDPFGAEQEDASGGQSAEGNDSNQGRSGGHGNQQGQEGKEPRQGQFNSLGQRQSDLRNELQSLIDRLRIDGAQSPKQFDDAGQAMEEAKKSLGDKDLEGATQSQGQALDQLRKGAQAMAEQMMANGEGQPGQGESNNNGRDPLGRPDRTNRPDLGLSVKVPDAIDIQRAREVLDEVRRRLGDPQRPTIELDYLERLLQSY